MMIDVRSHKLYVIIYIEIIAQGENNVNVLPRFPFSEIMNNRSSSSYNSNISSCNSNSSSCNNRYTSCNNSSNYCCKVRRRLYTDTYGSISYPYKTQRRKRTIETG